MIGVTCRIGGAHGRYPPPISAAVSGTARTIGADCINWMREAGFRDMGIVALTSEISMVTGIK